MKKNICIIGHFANGLKAYDGQTIKTRELYSYLKETLHDTDFIKIDTHNWRKHPTKILFSCINSAKKANDIILLPAHNGIKVFVPIFIKLKKIYNFKLHYVVIGGWIYSLIEKNNSLRKKIKKIDYIYVETNKLIKKLKKIDITNTFYMPNFKNLKRVSHERNNSTDNIKCCIYSRIEEEKGILDAITVIKKYNELNSKKIYLDIYGKIKPKFKSVFLKAILNYPNIEYKGAISPPNKSVDIIKKYDLLLFPTKYKTEGVPGTIIDAYFASVPVLASKWENFNEIITDWQTGLGYNFGDINDFYKKLCEISNNRYILNQLRQNCSKASLLYTPSKATQPLIKNIKNHE